MLPQKHYFKWHTSVRHYNGVPVKGLTFRGWDDDRYQEHRHKNYNYITPKHFWGLGFLSW